MEKVLKVKSSIEGDISVKQCKEGESKTIIPYFPLKDKVVVRCVFEESVLVVKDESKIRQSQPVSITVVAVGNEVHDINIGDKVAYSFTATIEPIHFKTNDQSIKSKMNLVKDNIMLSPTNKIEMIEYYSLPLYAINGIITE